MAGVYISIYLLLLWLQATHTLKANNEFIQCKGYQTSKAIMDNDSFSCMLLQPGQYPLVIWWSNGKRFEIALLLSVFLGWLGIDRFYLGYPALGLVKFCTFGFMLLWHLVDILLIAIQVVGPADGSHYVIDYFGAGLTQITRDENTYIKQPDDLS
ncbi:hypothetical protein LSH36_310g00064 [Paralvinella palmiformis]|uniref:TM2 domain-containing protein n=1 Tax=Paralvinella palmiformis TaxID=53620 RepID=A0AAD9N0V8_9ANNE|nr:hypothetical protein LSH36_310g00064 [Paralvinella palmiformis]